MKTAGIVLCGGRSTRMGLPKLALPFGDEPMLARVVRLLSQAVDHVVVVAAPNQQVPPLPDEVTTVHDRREGRGPLEGLAAGLSALPAEMAAYGTSCDVPLLVPAFVRRMFDLLTDEYEIVVPKEGKFYHPLAAVYRARALPAMERLLTEDRLRPFFLFQEVATREVSPQQWRDLDPQDRTLANLNQPDDYLAALASEGLAAPGEVLDRLGKKD